MKTIDTREIYILDLKAKIKLLETKLVVINKLLSVFNFDLNETLELQELGLLESKEDLIDAELDNLGI